MTQEKNSKTSLKTKPSKRSKKLGLIGLMAVVFGVITGGGLYNIVQNMAQGAAVGASMMGWAITGFGMLFLVMTFKMLADRKPELNSGIYQFAKESMGDFVGFMVAWGYWLCAAMGNVAFAVLLNDAFGYFFPVLLNHGWESMVLCTALIWSMYWIVSRGMHTASFINTLITLLKFVSILFIILLFYLFFNSEMALTDWWGNVSVVGSPEKQIKSTILVTLWCFIGVEGAMMLSQRAKKPKYVGTATVIGYFTALAVYAVITFLSFGIMSQSEQALLKDPSIGYILQGHMGNWYVIFIAVCTILAVLGGWIAWSMVCAQVPYTASKLGLYPKIFQKESKNGVPIFSLLMSSIIMQCFIFLVLSEKNVYLAAIEITSMMVLPAYLFTPVYGFISVFKRQITFAKERYRIFYLITTAIAAIFCGWMIVFTSNSLHLMTFIFYILGFAVFFIARKQNKSDNIPFMNRSEWFIAILLGVLSLYSLVQLILGNIKM